MGQIVRRKRRGRPSNTDRARINSSGAPPSPVDRRRSHRRRNVRYNFDIDDYVDDDEFYDDEDEEVGRREKKLRLLLYEDDSRSNTRRVRHAPASSSSDEYDDDEDVKYSKKRKIDRGDGQDDEDNEFEEITGRELEEEDDEEEPEQDEEEGTASDFPKGVPVPDKKTLELILDKLQKKDTYGVYSEPVDPDELPDYHDVIKHPMDFSTIRKKLAKGAYLTLKEFERDVFLICSNAMQYNAPDTIYYKQASSIQEQAKLRFQRLKANVDRSETEPTTDHKPTPSFSPAKKQLKKPAGRPIHDPIGPETISGNGVKVRMEEFPNAQTIVRQNSSEVLATENSCLPENSLDKDQELVPGKGLNIMSKVGRKAVDDENRRATYDTCFEAVNDTDSVFSIFEGESKQFIPVGLHVDHSYARSLARFAATLGSVAWKVASKTIEQALPAGVKYGRGWVGEYEPLPTQVLIMPGNYTQHFQKNPSIKHNNKSPKPTLQNNPRIPPLKQHNSFKEPPIQNPQSHPPPFFSSFQPNPNPPQVQLNHPPPPIITKKTLVDIPSPRRNVSLPPFNHPNSKNDGARPSYEQQLQTGLSDPVQMMKMLAERNQSQSQSQQNNVALTAAQAWMSLGGSGTHKQQNSVENSYNNNRQQQQQPQVSRFRGEVHFQGDKNPYQQQQPVQGGHVQNRNVGFPQFMTADLSRFQVQPPPNWRGVTPQMQQQQQLRPKQQESRPPDLNIGYQSSPVRHSTGMMVDSQQPDLALQL